MKLSEIISSVRLVYKRFSTIPIKKIKIGVFIVDINTTVHNI